MSASLAAEGLIDKLQCFELNELANAAYWYAVEELLNAPAHYCGASAYNVVKRGSLETLGTIGRSIFHYADTLLEGNKTFYDGKVYRDACGASLVFSPSGAIARITGLTLTFPDGQQFELIETGRTINGTLFKPVDDPDIYRSLIDSAQVAQECRDLLAFEKMRPLIDLARFCICPACLDRFDRREDCTACSGQGFVTKPLATGLR